MLGAGVQAGVGFAGVGIGDSVVVWLVVAIADSVGVAVVSAGADVADLYCTCQSVGPMKKDKM